MAAVAVAVVEIHHYSSDPSVVPVDMHQATIPGLYMAAIGTTPHIATLVNPICAT